MAKWRIRFYYSTFVDVEVEADTREEAISEGCNDIAAEEYDKELLGNLIECNDCDVELIDE